MVVDIILISIIISRHRKVTGHSLEKKNYFAGYFYRKIANGITFLRTWAKIFAICINLSIKMTSAICQKVSNFNLRTSLKNKSK